MSDVLAHPTVKPILESLLPIVAVKPWECYEAIAYHDILACVFARLLLWTHSGPLPRRDSPSEGWMQYIVEWRPGKPHRETWDGNFERAWNEVQA